MIPSRSRRRLYLSAARSVFWRHMHTIFHRPVLLIPSLVFPLFFYASFAGGLSAISNAPGFDYYDYDAFQFVFVLLQSAAFGGVFIGFSIGADFDSGFTRRLLLSTADRSAIIVGYGAAALVRGLMVWAMVFLIALATGMQVGGDGVDLFGLLWLAIFLNIVALLFASGMMFRFRTMQAAPAMQIPMFIFLMTSPVYVPRDLISGWVATAAKYNPATALVEAGRSLMAGDPFHVGLAFAVSFALMAVFALFAKRGLRQAEAEAA